MSNRIRVWVKDLDTGDVLEELGSCLTDSPSRAVQMYDEEQAWIDRGYNADIAWEWEDETKRAAAALGRIGGRTSSERKAKSSRDNGRLGGRPRKQQAQD